MSKCKHKYCYAYESKVEEYDMSGLVCGWALTTVTHVTIGMKMAFYICCKCNDVLMTEPFSGHNEKWE